MENPALVSAEESAAAGTWHRNYQKEGRPVETTISFLPHPFYLGHDQKVQTTIKVGLQVRLSTQVILICGKLALKTTIA